MNWAQFIAPLRDATHQDINHVLNERERFWQFFNDANDDEVVQKHPCKRYSKN